MFRILYNIIHILILVGLLGFYKVNHVSYLVLMSQCKHIIHILIK